MRLYTFTNMYLSSLQVGLQSAHVTSEMFIKYSKLPKTIMNPAQLILFEWASKHKTMIFLNGGYSSNLHNLSKFFKSIDNPYPWAFFYESEDALDSALTCIGIVLPPRIYKIANLCRKKNLNPYIFCNRDFRSTFSYLINKIHRKFIGIDKIHSLECDMLDLKFQRSRTKWECDLILELNKYELAR